MRKFIIPLALLCGSALAVETGASQNGESMEPQVTTFQHAKEKVEEYRIHNKLYMIKVMPNNGKSYFLVDSDGDGKLDKRHNQLDAKTQIPSWIASRLRVTAEQ